MRCLDFTKYKHIPTFMFKLENFLCDLVTQIFENKLFLVMFCDVDKSTEYFLFFLKIIILEKNYSNLIINCRIYLKFMRLLKVFFF